MSAVRKRPRSTRPSAPVSSEADAVRVPRSWLRYVLGMDYVRAGHARRAAMAKADEAIRGMELSRTA